MARRNPMDESMRHEMMRGDPRQDMKERPMKKKVGYKSAPVKTSGSFKGKSNKLGYGGRAAQLKAKGVPGGVIGNLARRAGAAPGGPNYHGGKRGR